MWVVDASVVTWCFLCLLSKIEVLNLVPHPPVSPDFPPQSLPQIFPKRDKRFFYVSYETGTELEEDHVE